MSPGSDSPGRRAERRYTDEEVRRLLQRASELESQSPRLPTPADGPTLRDLEVIAAEAGLDPALLRKAAHELDGARTGAPPAAGGGSMFLGAPHTVEYERVVPGEAPSGLLEALLPLIQRAAGGMGQPSLMGRTLTWTSSDPQRTSILQVSVSVRRGETRIVVQERFGNLAGALFGGIMGGVGGGVGMGVGMGVGLGALGSVLFASLFPPAVIGGSYLLARSLFRRTVQRRMRDLKGLMDDLVATVEDGMEEQSRRLEAGE
jgi:hypothetical protein